MDHPTIDCPDRTKQHCPDCHVLIQHCSDHTSVCGLKTWQYNKYADLYAKQPRQRVIIGFNTPFRFLKDGSWRKGTEDLRMYSPETGAMFRFDSDSDIVLLTTSYSPIRLVIVVKEKEGETEVFREKLLLLTSLKNIIVASALDKEFDRNSGRNTAKNSLIIATSANTQVDLQVSMTVYVPGSAEIRQFALRYDAATKKFLIPEGIDAEKIARANSNNVMMSSVATNQMALYGAGGPFPWECSTCVGAHHSTECNQPKLQSCFECHVQAKVANDHAPNCTAKNWYISKPIDVYVNIPAIRCKLTFKSPIIFDDQATAYEGLELFSSNSDTFFVFESPSQVSLYTTRFTRIRIPLVLQDTFNSVKTYTEKLVFLTSLDRTILGAHSSRQVNPNNMLQGFEHNTPLVLFFSMREDPSIKLDIYSGGGIMRSYDLDFNRDSKKFLIPPQVNVNSHNFVPMAFDAEPPTKPKSK